MSWFDLKYWYHFLITCFRINVRIWRSLPNYHYFWPLSLLIYSSFYPSIYYSKIILISYSHFQYHFPKVHTNLTSKSSITYSHSWQNLFLVDCFPNFSPDRTVYSFLSQLFFHLEQPSLLRTNDWPRTHYPDPGDKCSSWKVIVFDCIACYHCTCPTQACLTMHCNHSFLILYQIQKSIN